jgi:hypothetical protein
MLVLGQRRRARKPAKMAIVATMRKIISTADAPLRDNRIWTSQVA